MDIDFISEQEKQVCELLKSLNQDHIVSTITTFSKEERAAFVEQINRLNQTYPGGLTAYCSRGKKLLKDSCEDVNPYEGYSPEVPKGFNLDFNNVKEIDELEKIGLEELQYACFVLVAGGLGERLGYGGIKIEIPIDLITRTCYLEYYCRFILAIQKKSGAKTDIPLAIMVSDDTHDSTVKLLESNNYFGMKKDQVTIMKQEKVPALLDIEARFALSNKKLEIDTKPHGHGDVHTLIFMKGLAKTWIQQGKKWIILFQDTNPLVFRSYPAVLGVSKKYNFELNSITIPRKPGEAVGAICNLKNKEGKNLTINVEYNQLEALMKSTIGKEPLDDQGYSKFPGNTNSLIFSIPEYSVILEETQGLIAEFINPKFTDSTKTKFKTPTRLECMMQDYPKLLKSGERVGITQIDRRFCFSTCKNDLASAAVKFSQGLAPESASSLEHDFYWLNRYLLKVAGVEIEDGKKEDLQEFAGISLAYDPKIIITPEFGVTLAEIRGKFKGQNKISAKSSLVLDGDLSVENLSLNGSLWAKNNLKDVKIEGGNYLTFSAIDPQDKSLPENLRIRGYNLKGEEAISKL